MDATIVIRSSNERTIDLCEFLIKAQFNTDQIFLIKEEPFSKAVQKTFEIGIENKKKWTLAIDADVLIFPDSINRMLEKADSLKQEVLSKIFVYQGFVACNLFKNFRAGGLHLYKTEFLPTAINFISHEEGILRPESKTYYDMNMLGYYNVIDKEIYGFHAFEQTYFDYYKQGFFRAQKHGHNLVNIFERWVNDQYDPLDSRCFLQGIIDGLNFSGNFKVDAEFLNDTLKSGFEKLEIQEKHKIKQEEYLIIINKLENRVENYNNNDLIYKIRPFSNKNLLLEKTSNGFIKLGRVINKYRRDLIQKRIRKFIFR